MGVRAAALLLSALGLSTASSCELSLPRPRQPTVSLRMQGSPPEASVTIDDEYVGPLNVVMARGVALPPGQHRISVEAPGYFPVDRIVEARDQPVRIDVRLQPVPD